MKDRPLALQFAGILFPQRRHPNRRWLPIPASATVAEVGPDYKNPMWLGDFGPGPQAGHDGGSGGRRSASLFRSRRNAAKVIESPSLSVSFSTLNATTQTAFTIGGDEPWPAISALPSPR